MGELISFIGGTSVFVTKTICKTDMNSQHCRQCCCSTAYNVVNSSVLPNSFDYKKVRDVDKIETFKNSQNQEYFILKMSKYNISLT